jgi:hypothetical protein
MNGSWRSLVKAGDIVRFVEDDGLVYPIDRTFTSKKHIGLLIDYDSLSKTAVVLHESEILYVRGHLIEKAGKKDFDKQNS